MVSQSHFRPRTPRYDLPDLLQTGDIPSTLPVYPAQELTQKHPSEKRTFHELP